MTMFNLEAIYNITTGEIYAYSNEFQDSKLMLKNWPNSAIIDVPDTLDIQNFSYRVNIETMELETIPGKKGYAITSYT
jgi:hypothetical protein